MRIDATFQIFAPWPWYIVKNVRKTANIIRDYENTNGLVTINFIFGDDDYRACSIIGFFFFFLNSLAPWSCNVLRVKEKKWHNFLRSCVFTSRWGRWESGVRRGAGGSEASHGRPRRPRQGMLRRCHSGCVGLAGSLVSRGRQVTNITYKAQEWGGRIVRMLARDEHLLGEWHYVRGMTAVSGKTMWLVMFLLAAKWFRIAFRLCVKFIGRK